MAEAFGQGDDWYIRERGREEGPYSLETLRKMVQTKRLARHNQVSVDKLSWRRASEALPPEVFGLTPAPPPAPRSEPSPAPDLELPQPPLVPPRSRVRWEAVVPWIVGGVTAASVLAVLGFLAALFLSSSPTDQTIHEGMRPSLATVQGFHPTDGKKRCYALIVSRSHAVAPVLAATLQGLKVEARHKDGHDTWHTAHLVTADPVTGLCVLSANFGSDVKHLDPPDVRSLPERRASLRLLMPDSESSRAIEDGIMKRIVNDEEPDEMLLVAFDDAPDAADDPLGRTVVDNKGKLVGMVVDRLPNGDSLCVPAREIRTKKKEAAALPADHVMEPITLPRKPVVSSEFPGPDTAPPDGATIPGKPESATDMPAPGGLKDAPKPSRDSKMPSEGETQTKGGSNTGLNTRTTGSIEDRNSSNTRAPGVLRDVTKSIMAVADNSLPELPSERADALGREHLKEVLKKHRPCRDDRLQAMVRTLAGEVIRSADRQAMDFHVTLVDDSELNAYAFVGANIVVNTGLLDFADFDEEMIQFVLAHEIGHIVLGHVDLPFRRKMLTEGLAGLGNVAGDAISVILKNSPYNQSQEEEADCFAADTLRSMNKSTAGGVRFFRKVSQQSGRGGISRKGDADTILDGLFDSHPEDSRRIELLTGGCEK